jgi:hypothetical protein
MDYLAMSLLEQHLYLTPHLCRQARNNLIWLVYTGRVGCLSSLRAYGKISRETVFLQATLLLQTLRPLLFNQSGGMLCPMTFHN